MISVLQNMFKRRPVADDSRIDRLTYAIGDVHGSLHQLEGLIDIIKRDAEAYSERPRLVLLGDYVDRGPCSAQVMDRIVALDEENANGRGWCDLEILMGNHEQAMMDFLETGDGGMWLKYGGVAALRSYGINVPESVDSAEVWSQLRDAFDSAFPRAHRDLIDRMKLCLQGGDYLFVHAGVSPHKPLEQQNADTLLWIRNEFLLSTKACDFVVVHGHTPTLEPVNMRWRIGVDTGAYDTGVLTAVRLYENMRHFLRLAG